MRNPDVTCTKAVGIFPVIEEYSRQGWWLAYFLSTLLATCAIARCNRHVRSPWLKL